MKNSWLRAPLLGLLMSLPISSVNADTSCESLLDLSQQLTGTGEQETGEIATDLAQAQAEVESMCMDCTGGRRRSLNEVKAQKWKSKEFPGDKSTASIQKKSQAMQDLFGEMNSAWASGVCSGSCMQDGHSCVPVGALNGGANTEMKAVENDKDQIIGYEYTHRGGRVEIQVICECVKDTAA